MNSQRPSGVAVLITGTLNALLLHQLYAVSAPFIEIENRTPDTRVLINGDAFETRANGRLAVPCHSGETLTVSWNQQQTGVLCQTRLYIGFDAKQ